MLLPLQSLRALFLHSFCNFIATYFPGFYWPFWSPFLEGENLDRIDLSFLFSGNYVVYWHKGTDMLTARDMMVKPDPRMRLDSNQYNLQIKNIKETDAGDYTCKVVVMGQPIYITHTLEILGKNFMVYMLMLKM